MATGRGWRAALLLGLAACAGPAAMATGEDIVVCGQRYPIGAPVVLWSDAGGYDASVPGPVLAPAGPAGPRYTPGRSWEPDPAAVSLDRLREHVDLFVLHYDIAGFSRNTFHLLQDERALSAHFLLDVDGTLYQTLDLRDQAWHGRFTNARSIGVEIANMGVFAPDDPSDDPYQKRRWYVRDGERLRLAIPAEFGDAHIRGTGPFYSSRNEPVRGRVHGREWAQFDFTPQQYATLVKLTAALRRLFPRIELEAPRDAEGRVRTDELPRAELDAFHGIVGHGHITTERNEPGPAFQWDAYLRAVRELEARGAASDVPVWPMDAGARGP